MILTLNLDNLGKRLSLIGTLKTSGDFNHIWMYDFLNAIAMLYQLSYEATVESCMVHLLGAWVTVIGLSEWKIKLFD